MLEVLITERAQTELDQAHVWWANSRSEEQADRWYKGFMESMLDLATAPEQCALAVENDAFPIEIRQLNYWTRA